MMMNLISYRESERSERRILIIDIDYEIKKGVCPRPPIPGKWDRVCELLFYNKKDGMREDAVLFLKLVRYK
jgi:hypothetical protein